MPPWPAGWCAPARGRSTSRCYAEPIEPSRAILGLDRSYEPDRKLLEWNLRRAARLATPVASGPVRLYQLASDPRDPYAILMNVPVYRGAVTPPRKAERMGELAGFVVAIFRVGGLVEAGLRGEPEAGLDIAVLNDAPAAAGDPLYYHHSRAPGARALAPEDWAVPPEQVPALCAGVAADKLVLGNGLQWRPVMSHNRSSRRDGPLQPRGRKNEPARYHRGDHRLGRGPGRDPDHHHQAHRRRLSAGVPGEDKIWNGYPSTVGSTFSRA